MTKPKPKKSKTQKGFGRGGVNRGVGFGVDSGINTNINSSIITSGKYRKKKF